MAPAEGPRDPLSSGVLPRHNPFAANRVERLEWRDRAHDSRGLEGSEPGAREAGAGEAGGSEAGARKAGGTAPGGESAVTVPHLLERLDELGGRAALVGPKGHGKTTLLDAMERELAARGLRPRRLYVYPDRPLPRQELRRFLSAVGPRDFLLLDGAGHLKPWTWWRIRLTARRAAGLLVATHEPGLLPTLHPCRTSPELLRGLVDELLAGREPPVPLPAAEELYQRHHGNLRLALRELYDRCAGR